MTSKKKARRAATPKRRARNAGSGDGRAAEQIFTAFERRMIEGAAKRGGTGKDSPTPPGSDVSGTNANQSDDARLWAALSRTVKPLPRRQPAPPSAEPTATSRDRSPSPPAETPKPTRPPRVRRAGPAPTPPPPAPYAPPPLAHGDSPGVDKRTSAKLRRGLMPIEATLDLHGLGRDRARDRLVSFITGHHAAGRRCVLVITGKGLKDDWSPGVIRSSIPEWLNDSPLRPLVLSFATAQPQHGGSGAIYVLLKRAR